MHQYQNKKCRIHDSLWSFQIYFRLKRENIMLNSLFFFFSRGNINFWFHGVKLLDFNWGKEEEISKNNNNKNIIIFLTCEIKIKAKLLHTIQHHGLVTRPQLPPFVLWPDFSKRLSPFPETMSTLHKPLQFQILTDSETDKNSTVWDRQSYIF